MSEEAGPVRKAVNGTKNHTEMVREDSTEGTFRPSIISKAGAVVGHR